MDQSIDIPISFGTSGSKVTNGANIALLANDLNWTNNLYTGVAISGQFIGDWYDDGAFRYRFITATTISRIPYTNL